MVTIKEFRTLQKKIRILKNLKRDLNNYEEFLTISEKLSLNTTISFFEIDCKNSINKINKELLKDIKWGDKNEKKTYNARTKKNKSRVSERKSEVFAHARKSKKRSEQKEKYY